MSRKKTTKMKENDIMSLPSDNKEMEWFIKKHKTYLTEQALSSIEFAVKNKLPFVEVFKFNDSEFVITIASKDYLQNVNHIYEFYLETEKYELCPRVVELQSLLKNLKNDEKEIEKEIEGDTE